jgi:hypothetical protein
MGRATCIRSPAPFFIFRPNPSGGWKPAYTAVYSPLSYPSFPSYFVASWSM